MDLLCGYKVHPSVLPMSNGSDVGCEVVKSCMISQRTWKHASGVTAAKKKDTSFHLNEYRRKLSPGFSRSLLGPRFSNNVSSMPRSDSQTFPIATHIYREVAHRNSLQHFLPIPHSSKPQVRKMVFLAKSMVGLMMLVYNLYISLVMS